MSSRKKIINDIINKTQNIIEKTFGIELNNYIMIDIETLLDKNYLEETLSNKELLFNADCWGGGVWDLMYHKYDIYKPILLLNYFERENNSRCLSPIMAHFPYDELNKICKKGLEKI